MCFPGFAMHFFNNCSFYKLHDPFHVTFHPPSTQRNTLSSNSQILITLTTITWIFIVPLKKTYLYEKELLFLPFNSGGKTVNIKSKNLSAAAGEQTVTFCFWGGSNSDEQTG